MNNSEAVREAAWVAKEARRLGFEVKDADPQEWAAYFERKARLLEHMGQPEMAETARVAARDWAAR